jgi:hypothetical protein
MMKREDLAAFNLRILGAILTMVGLVLPSRFDPDLRTATSALSGARDWSGYGAALFCVVAVGCAFQRPRWIWVICAAVSAAFTPALAAMQFVQGSHYDDAAILGAVFWVIALPFIVRRRWDLAIEAWLGSSAIFVLAFHHAFGIWLFAAPKPWIGFHLSVLGTSAILMSVVLKIPIRKLLQRIGR